MNVISRPAIYKAMEKHADARAWLKAWWYAAKGARWESLHGVRAEFPSVDQVGRCLVFNACGNRYRLIVGVTYATEERGGTLFVKHFLTHADYERQNWRGDC